MLIRIMKSPWAIFAGMILGVLFGILVPSVGLQLEFLGDFFIKLMRMGVVPLIFCNVVYAIVGIGEAKRFARLGGKVVAIFMTTTFCAVLLGGFIAMAVEPGVGFVYANAVEPVANVGTLPTFSQFLLKLVPTNILQAMAEANMLQTVVFAIISGIALLMLGKETQDTLKGIFRSVSLWMMKLLEGVILLAPIGIFALSCGTASKYGTDIFGPISKLVVTMFAAGLIQLFVVYPLLYFTLTRKNPYVLLAKLFPVIITAFTTRSTNATLPVSLATSKNVVGVPEDIADFVIPLGASCNTDGGAIWYGVVAMFVAQSIGLDMPLSMMISIAFIGTSITLGMTGIPNAMFVMVPIFLTTIGFPLEFMGVMGIFPVVETIMTACNVTGDNVTAAIIGEDEKKYVAQKEAAGRTADLAIS